MDGVPGSLSCNIGAEMTGLTRSSLSLAGVLRPKKCRKCEWRPSCSVLPALATDGLLGMDVAGLITELVESIETIDRRLRLLFDCL